MEDRIIQAKTGKDIDNKRKWYRQEDNLRRNLFIKSHILGWFISQGKALQMNLDILQLGFIHEGGNQYAVWEPFQVRNDPKCGISKP